MHTQVMRSDMGGFRRGRGGLLVPAAFSGDWHAVAHRGGYVKKSGTRVLGEKIWEDVIVPVASFMHIGAKAAHHYLNALRNRGRMYGQVLWADAIENIVVNQGLNDLLDVTLSGATQDTTWFVGLTDGTPTVAAGDTLASHAGWVEVTAYDETNRVSWVDGGASGQSVSNSGSPAVFTINANGTVVGGAFLAGVNTGTSGRIYAAGAFTAGDKDLDDNDTVTVTATFTAAAA